MSLARPRLVRILALLLPAVVLAQGPAVGLIEIYGAQRVSHAEIRKKLAMTEGGLLPKSKGDIEEAIATIGNVVAAHLEAACCEAGKAILYVGIEEKGATRFTYHAEPTAEDVVLPEDIGLAYRDFLVAARDAARAGVTTEDLTAGHSLLDDEKTRTIQMGFVDMADEYRAVLKKVIRESASAEDRAAAVYVIGYARDKLFVQDDVQYALRDPDETVRANALRALAALAVYAQKHPEEKLRVSPVWMIEMLGSLVWTDRHTAAVALVTMTESRDQSVLDQLRERALPSILEMARWRHLPHALPGFILAGRIAGVTEQELQDAWNKERREDILKRLAPRKR